MKIRTGSNVQNFTWNLIPSLILIINNVKPTNNWQIHFNFIRFHAWVVFDFQKQTQIGIDLNLTNKSGLTKRK